MRAVTVLFGVGLFLATACQANPTVRTSSGTITRNYVRTHAAVRNFPPYPICLITLECERLDPNGSITQLVPSQRALLLDDLPRKVSIRTADDSREIVAELLLSQTEFQGISKVKVSPVNSKETLLLSVPN